MHYQKYLGIIIKKTAVKDADQFLTILTKGEGKLSVYACGVRTLVSKRRASLDYFSEINFEVVEKSGRLTLMSVELVNDFMAAKKGLYDISRLFQIAELVDGLLPEGEENEFVYELLHKALSHLEQFAMPEYLIRFKRRLLRELGYGEGEISDSNLDSYIESLLDKPLRAKLI
ncbi:MAG: DNA repair protein RecO [bacterium]